MTEQTEQSGFSAVELMISLFIAVAFIASGYQLYSVIVKDGATARYRAQASNIAYTNLRKYANQPSGNCTTGYTITPTPTLTANEIKSLPQLDSLTTGGNPRPAELSVATSCPYGTSSSIWRITVTIKYGSPQKEVSHAIFSSL